ncbi:MAG: hypothetical protein MUO26_14515 [Methanotrichaceae archaeon]|nr:hypothetical protein [Methanotrichaceae archaeon]
MSTNFLMPLVRGLPSIVAVALAPVPVPVIVTKGAVYPLPGDVKVILVTLVPVKTA